MTNSPDPDELASSDASLVQIPLVSELGYCSFYVSPPIGRGQIVFGADPIVIGISVRLAQDLVN